MCTALHTKQGLPQNQKYASFHAVSLYKVVTDENEIYFAGELFVSTEKSYAIRAPLRHCWPHARLTARNVTGMVTGIRSILEYACIVWRPYTTKLVNNIEPIQNQAAGFVSDNFNFRHTMTSIKHQLKLQLLKIRRKTSRFSFPRTLYNGNTCLNRDRYSLLPLPPSRQNDSQNVREISSRTDMLMYSFSGNTIGECNSLQAEVLSASPNYVFKNYLGRLLQSCLYGLVDWFCDPFAFASLWYSCGFTSFSFSSVLFLFVSRCHLVYIFLWIT